MSGTSSLLVTGSIVEKTVTFSSKNPVDPTTYKGVITAIISYAITGSFGFDILSYNSAVQRVDPAVGNIPTLHYFLITLNNDQPNPTTRVFCNEWISPGSFSVIQDTTVFSVDIYDIPNNGGDAIIALLRANGYNAVLVPTS